MRELKFRAWDKNEKKWIENENYLYLDPDGLLYDYDSWDKYFMDVTKDVIVEQYTGLKDKTGKEIYEGDILKTEQLDSNLDVDIWTMEEIGTAVVTVSLYDGVCISDDSYGWDIFDENSIYNLQYIEIIGNIHSGENNET